MLDFLDYVRSNTERSKRFKHHVCPISYFQDNSVQLSDNLFKYSRNYSDAQLNENKYIQFICMDDIFKIVGLVRDLNPGPLAHKARIIPLDQRATIGNRNLIAV